MEWLREAIEDHRKYQARQAADRIRSLSADMKAALNGTLNIDPVNDPGLFVLGAFAEYGGMEFFLDKRDDVVMLRVERACPRCRRHRLSQEFLAQRKYESLWEPLTRKLAEWCVKEPWCQSCKERMALPWLVRPLFHLARWYETLRHYVCLAWGAGKRAAS